MNTSKKVPMMSWNDRFALIDKYSPSDSSICTAFNLTPNELKTANALRTAGTFQANDRLDTTKFSNLFSTEVDPIITQTVYVNTPKVETKTVHTNMRPETATKKVVVKVNQKRGRKGNKITSAFLAVTNEPIAVDRFVMQHGVSVAVLRQSKRFIEQMSEEDVAKVGKIVVKQNKETNTLMIWREDI